MSSEDDRISIKLEDGNSTLKGVLVHLKSRRQKKSVSWKEDGLETIKYFELDETERGISAFTCIYYYQILFFCFGSVANNVLWDGNSM